jgi:hypothetical protein
MDQGVVIEGSCGRRDIHGILPSYSFQTGTAQNLKNRISAFKTAPEKKLRRRHPRVAAHLDSVDPDPKSVAAPALARALRHHDK